MFKLVLFDFDGVLFDSNEIAHQIVVDLAPKFRFTAPSRQEVRTTGSRESVKKLGLGWFGLWRFLQHARREMTSRSSLVRPFPEVPEVLAALRQRGVHLGVVSSNSQENVRSHLKKSGMLDLFSVIECGGAYLGKHRKIKRAVALFSKSVPYELHSSEVLYVGDETRDIEACRKSQVPIAAVGWGYHDPDLLRSCEPQFLIQSPGQLLEIVP